MSVEIEVRKAVVDYETNQISLSEFWLVLYKLQNNSKQKLGEIIRKEANIVTLLLLATFERTNPAY